MKFLFFFLWVQFAFAANEPKEPHKLLDKIIAVVNAKVITLSEIQRVEATLPARREIAPQTYDQAKYSSDQLLELVIQSKVIRDKMSAQGYVISDDSVESRIRQTEQKLGLARSDLLKFLATKNITFEEYFELIRESMEYNLFAGRIIAPMISITDQEIKNEYYKRNVNNTALTFKYHLVDYIVPASARLKYSDEQIIKFLEDYQITTRFPPELSGTDIAPIDNVKEEVLSPDFQKVLKPTNEGSFTLGVKQDDVIHFFYVKTKDLEESQNYVKFKDQIQMELFNSKSKMITNSWFEREYLNYYIKKFI